MKLWQLLKVVSCSAAIRLEVLDTEYYLLWWSTKRPEFKQWLDADVLEVTTWSAGILIQVVVRS